MPQKKKRRMKPQNLKQKKRKKSRLKRLKSIVAIKMIKMNPARKKCQRKKATKFKRPIWLD